MGKKGIEVLKLSDLVEDIRARTTDASLMEKYGLTSEELSQALSRLVLKGYLSRSELEKLAKRGLSEQEIASLRADLRDGLFYEEIREKYDLSEEDLRRTFHEMAEAGLVSEDDIQSGVRAVKPKDAVQDFLANVSEERLREKYHLSEDELAELFTALADRSYLSADEVAERYGKEVPDDEPSMVPICETTGPVEQSLVSSVLEDAGIDYTYGAKGPQTLFYSGLEEVSSVFLVDRAHMEEARELVANVREMAALFDEKTSDHDGEVIDTPGSMDEPEDAAADVEWNSDGDVHDTPPPSVFNYWIECFGLLLVIAVLAYFLGWI